MVTDALVLSEKASGIAEMATIGRADLAYGSAEVAESNVEEVPAIPSIEQADLDSRAVPVEEHLELEGELAAEMWLKAELEAEV